jgi:hypothetical protein
MTAEGSHDDTCTKPSVRGSYDASRDTEHGHARLNPPLRPWSRIATPAAEILEGPYDGEGTKESPYICQWLDEDPEDPQQFSKGYKAAIVGMVSIGMCFNVRQMLTT